MRALLRDALVRHLLQVVPEHAERILCNLTWMVKGSEIGNFRQAPERRCQATRARAPRAYRQASIAVGGRMSCASWGTLTMLSRRPSHRRDRTPRQHESRAALAAPAVDTRLP